MRRHIRLARQLVLFPIAATLFAACLSRPLERIEARTTASVTETLAQSRIDKIDIVLGIDNSGSMADKQQILAEAVPRLVEALVNPPCVDADGNVVATPASPLELCAAGAREFEPVLDIHIGILSTSLGPRASASCGVDEMYNNDDNGELISRTDANDDSAALPTYEDKGFLAWRPEETGSKPGLYSDVGVLTADLEAMVRGVGENGCGLEAQLESWYRFLVDPEPYADVEPTYDADNVQGKNELTGIDEGILQQRADFLRPDSLVAILMLSDENDCSFRADGYGWLTGSIDTLDNLRGRAVCAENPQDPCCTPCGQAPETCPDDPTCTSTLPPEHDSPFLTCFDQKRRYGVDLLYPIQRYVDGLTQIEVANQKGELVPNPLLVSPDGIPRGRDRLFLAGIVGVPWQLIARNPADLTEGFQNADELAENGTWDVILGDPQKGIDPTDPHMVESIFPRPGLPGPSSGPNADPMNGHEFTVKLDSWGDLQHACIFQLPDPIACDSSFGNCNCDTAHYENNPLCQAADGSYGATQYRAKGYPGLRQLAVMKGIGEQAIVGSICPAQMSDSTARDYGYRPAIEALIERLKGRLRGLCLQRSLEADDRGQVACLVLEGRALADGESCDCSAAGRIPVDAAHQAAVADALTQPAATAAGIDCVCAIEQLAGAELAACQQSTEPEPQLDGQPVDGWCYIDATSFPPIGNPELVAHCRDAQERTIRFVGAGEPDSGTVAFITCHQ